MNVPDRPVGRLLEPRKPEPPEPDPQCDFCGGYHREDAPCDQKHEMALSFAEGLRETA